jgi:hypothetical protein
MNTLESNVNFVKDFNCLSKDEVFDGNTIKRYLELINEVKISE